MLIAYGFMIVLILSTFAMIILQWYRSFCDGEKPFIFVFLEQQMLEMFSQA
jgi:hypothetical protein